jgi:hypothetical protein
MGPNIRGSFGWSIAATPDTDGDGQPELSVAAPAPEPNGMVWKVRSSELMRGSRTR